MKTINQNKQTLNSLLQTTKPNLITLTKNPSPSVAPPILNVSSQNNQQQQQSRTIVSANKINDELAFLMGTQQQAQSNTTLAQTAAAKTAKSFENELDDLMASIEPAINKTDSQQSQPQIVNIQAASTTPTTAVAITQYHNDSLNNSLMDDFPQLDGLYDSNESTLSIGTKSQWCDVDVTKNTTYLVTGYKLTTNKDNLEVTTVWFGV